MNGFGNFENILRKLGDEDQAMGAIDNARHSPQNAAPSLMGQPKENLAQMDRLAWGQSARKRFGAMPAMMMGAATIAPYEAIKGAAQSKIPLIGGGARKVMSGFGSLLNRLGGPGDLMKIDNTTSPASFKNVLAFMRGAGQGREKEEDPYQTFAHRGGVR